MRETRILMGMPIIVEVIGNSRAEEVVEKVFGYFRYVDEKFSPFKETSELSKINRNELSENEWSDDMKKVFALSEKTKRETDGYFDIVAPDGKCNPSGLVKGWAIWNAAKILDGAGFKNYYVEAGGDIQIGGRNAKNEDWRIGIRNPFNKDQIVKVITLKSEGVATSGTYERGLHIWNPKNKEPAANDVVSLTVIGPNIYEADRFATAAFAMGREGIGFIENLSGFEGYMIDKDGLATMTSGFGKYILDR